MPQQHPFNTDIYNLVTYALADPGAGANLSFPCPQGTRLEIIYVQARLICDATVANRVFQLACYNGISNFQYVIHNRLLVAASSNWFRASAGGNHIDIAGVAAFIPLRLPSPMIINYGESLITDLFNIQASDQIASVIIRAKLWIDPS